MLLEKQIKALPADDAAFAATFEKGASVFLPNFAAKIGDPDLEIGAQIAHMNPHAEMKSAKLKTLVAGGTPSLVWFAAEVEIVVLSQEPGYDAASTTHMIRIVEILDGAANWKAVAASFTAVRSLREMRQSRGEIPSSTAPGPLAPLLVTPDELAKAAAPEVVVFGTDAAERAVGHVAAKALLGKWRKLPLAIEEADKVREVRTAAYGYAMADVNIARPSGPPYRMSAFLIARPSPGGAWSVVAVSYGAL